MRELRPHQIKAIDMLKRSIIAGHKRPMIQASTGFGKTILAAHIVNGAQAKGNRVVFTVPAVSLIDQTVRSFYDNGIREVGVIQADHPMTNPSRPVQVASVQTLQRRDLPETDMVLVDEAHRAHRIIFEWMAKKPNLLFCGLSATPWTKGLGKYYDDLIIASTTQELIDTGYLSDFRVFAPSKPDLTGVRTTAGDYNEADLSEVMDEPGLTADIVSSWIKLGENRPTLCFAVDRKHAKSIKKDFTDAGVPVAYVDAFTSDYEREDIRKSFAAGHTKVVVNVGVLTTGVDWDVRCIILARPTKSNALYTQIIGRGLRTADGKPDCLILDHSDTTQRLGFVTDIHFDELDKGKLAGSQSAKKDRPVPLPKECPSCKFLKPAKVHKCPNCGFAPEQQTDIEVAPGELKALKGKAKDVPKRSLHL